MKKVLVIQLRQLGDILLTTPFIKNLKENFLDIELHFLSHSMGKKVLPGKPWIDRHIIYNQWDGILENITGTIQLLKDLKKENYDAVFDLMNNPRSAIFTFATQAPLRMGYRGGRSWAYNKIFIQPEVTSHYVPIEKNMMLEKLNIPVPHTMPFLDITDADQVKVQEFFKTHPPLQSKDPIILLSPTHRRKVRRWPAQNYIRLADWLIMNWQAKIIWLWGPGEHELVEKMMRKTSFPTYMAPELNLREMGYLMKNANLFIGNSNGLSHVAVTQDISSLQLHGPTSGKSWCPNNQRHQYLQASECSDGGDNIGLISMEVLIDKLIGMRSF